MYTWFVMMMVVMVCVVEVSAVVSDDTEESAVYEQLFDLLSCHRIQDAVDVAGDAGLFRLATLVAQVGGDDSVNALVSHLLDQEWQLPSKDGLLPIDTIPEVLLDIYKIISGKLLELQRPGDLEEEDQVGEVAPEHTSVFKSSSVSWVHALGMIFWYSQGPFPSISASLNTYHVALEYDVARPPCIIHNSSSVGLTERRVEQHNPAHALYSLLNVLYGDCDEQMDEHGCSDRLFQVLQCCDVGGFSNDGLDYQGPALTLFLLQCIGLVSEERSITEAVCINQVRSHFIAQLLQQGLWKWALFVVLQIPCQVRRTVMAKDILSRWVAVGDAEDVEFVVEGLHIPRVWVDQAMAMYWRSVPTVSGAQHSARSYVNGRLWLEANEVICGSLAPSWIVYASAGVSNDMMEDHLLQLLSECEIGLRHCKADSWCVDSGLLLLDYLKWNNRRKELLAVASEAASTTSSSEEDVVTADTMRDLHAYVVQEAATLYGKLVDSSGLHLRPKYSQYCTLSSEKGETGKKKRAMVQQSHVGTVVVQSMKSLLLDTLGKYPELVPLRSDEMEHVVEIQSARRYWDSSPVAAF